MSRTSYQYLVKGFYQELHDMLFAILLISHFVTGVKCLLHQESLPSPTQSPDFMHQLLLQEQQLRIELQKQITGIQSQIQGMYMP